MTDISDAVPRIKAMNDALAENDRLRLTGAERQAIEAAISDYELNDDDADCARMVAALRGLLERLG